jgi:hypothetical protein
MNRRIPFVENELRVTETVPGLWGRPDFLVRDTPVTPRENVSAFFFEKEPYWIPTLLEMGMVVPPIYNETLARGGRGGLVDAFGVEWEWVEQVLGSTVRPGAPFLSDANEWKDKIVFPDLDKWDWANAAKTTVLDPKISTVVSLINGFWFERLVSFLDFAGAAVALIDEDQKPAVQAFFEAMTEFGAKVVDKFCAYWPSLDGFNIHDDWAGQKSPFFSEEVGRELFVPHMRALTDHIHSKGKYVTLHSCGHGESRVQCFIDAGFDAWDPQEMNDTAKLYEEVGDKIIIAVTPELFDPATTPEEEQRARARDYVDRFSQPGKPTHISFYGMSLLTPAFQEELYSYSRKKYSGLR